MAQEKELEGRVAVITGAGSGIGKAAALRLAREGAKVVAVSRSDDEIKQTVAEIEQAGGEAIAVTADISKEPDMKALYEQVEKTYGRLDIVFANAGINGVWAPLDEIELDEWQKTIDINLTGTFLTVKHALRLLKQAGKGSIIITASVNGTRIFTNTGATAYSSTKAAQVAFTQMIALELAKHKIRVNVVCPGAIETNIEESTEHRHLDRVKEPAEFPAGKIPLTDGKPGTSEQVADLVLFLASDRASHITGTPIWIDGAESLLLG
ncbi:glucose 1-dehydrogenase [Rudanella paleaurantiibacter]|uniref:Glucose 1-dehydrogenase n=1 Tax=Rudanella paleaurantiibacter TaxID=2614655 RepID=A0A7J5TWA8_9BACT|nr:SDR family NAD(P)-dependent oxidoreductase [Rudanella paleaurantiibacter]KAB7728713.1 glucose 1-dehydrogenase [Rudanella paleaurantiibacter]